MYLASEAIRFLIKDKANNLSPGDIAKLTAFKKSLDGATRFIPLWVKIAVAIALGLGTMVGWKRIVVTVGEKIGKTHLTYAQGASAEFVAMATIGAADCTGFRFRRPTCCRRASQARWPLMDRVCNGRTVRNLLMAWVLTLPASIMLAGALYWAFTKVF